MVDKPATHSTVGDSIERTLERLTNAASVDAVFSSPIERGNVTIVGCSEVNVGLGFGRGGGADGPEQTESQAKSSYGEGGGGGGSARSRPVAVIVVTQDGVSVQPVFDLTKVVLASFTTFGFLIAWFLRFNNAARGRKNTRVPSLQAFKRAIEE